MPIQWQKCSILTSIRKGTYASLNGLSPIKQFGRRRAPIMIDVIIADHQELFHIGAAQVLATAKDVRVIDQSQSPQQLLRALKSFTPHVLVLSTSFLPAFPEISPVWKPNRTALLVLAEDHDHTAYVRWLGARGVVYRSMDRPVLVDALRRVARGELFVQSRSSDMKIDPTEAA